MKLLSNAESMDNKEISLKYFERHYQEIKEKQIECLICEVCKLCIRKDGLNGHLKSLHRNKFINHTK